MLLVTEFPPPPYYYTLASHNKLTPPEIPHRAFRVAAKRVRQEKERARLESERIRLEAEVKDDDGDGGADGEDKSKDVVMTTTTDNQQQQQDNNNNNNDDDDDDSITDPNNPNEPIVAVFGEIVEDPTLLLHNIDQQDCNNPTILRDNVKRLNRSVLQGFLKLVSKLVHDPIENKSSRDELSHDIFLMLQECNKFREHQAREILIETLERQLERREGGLEVLRGEIRVVEGVLKEMEEFQKEQMQQQQQQRNVL